jgi:hypothetical protein
MQTMSRQKFQRQLISLLDPMRECCWTDEPGCQLLDSCRSGGLFRGDGFCALVKFVRSFQISQSCLEERDEFRLDLDAVLLFQMGR